MGREIKMVPVDFSWPLSEIWNGFINPFYKHCHDCEQCSGSGYSVFAKRYKDEWYGYVDFDPVAYGSKLLTRDTPYVRDFVHGQVDRSIAEAMAGKGFNVVTGNYDSFGCYYTINGLLTTEQAYDREFRRILAIWNNTWSHHLIQADVDALIAAGQFTQYGDKFVPTPESVQDLTIRSMFHTSSFGYTCIRARCERNSQPVLCSSCNGEGSKWESPELEAKCEAWIKTEPPTGPAYQVWETVSEGSPITPPFEDPHKLAEYLAEHPRLCGPDTTVDGYLKWITEIGTAPSAIVTNGVFMDGVAGMLASAKTESLNVPEVP